MSKEHPLDAENRRLCEELGAKPCPFCGGMPELFGSDRIGWEVDCAACNATGGGGETKADAVVAWNRRPADPPQDAAPALLEALEGLLTAIGRQQSADIWWRNARAALAAVKPTPPKESDR